jgi:hypothetical protein
MLVTSLWLFREMFLQKPDSRLIIIDKIQKVPILLNQAHAIIEEHQLNLLFMAKEPL